MEWINSIKSYKAYNEQEENDKKVMLQCIEDLENILTRENEIAHITSSGFIVNEKRDKVLMVHHNIYNTWAWTGGHADGEEDLLVVAIKEAKEETGVKNIKPITNDIFSIDILPVLGHIKRGKYVSSHLHLNVTYVVEADEKELLVVKEDENSGVKWIPIEEISLYSDEPYMIKVYNKLISKIKSKGI